MIKTDSEKNTNASHIYNLALWEKKVSLPTFCKIQKTHKPIHVIQCRLQLKFHMVLVQYYVMTSKHFYHSA